MNGTEYTTRVHRLYTLLIFLLSLIPALSARAESQRDLDAILTEKGSLEAFLESAEQRAKYYHGLKEWMKFDEATFTIDNFNSALDEIARLTKIIPGLKERLMETNGLGTRFEVKSLDVRTLNPDAWRAKREEWMDSLRQRSASIRDMQQVQEIYAPIEQAVAAAGALSKTAGKKALSTFFEALRADPQRLEQVQAANAFLILQRLSHGDLRARLESNEPKVVLSALRELGQGGSPYPVGASSSIVELIPHPDAILGDSNIFPYPDQKLGQRETVYEFVPLLRRFHGLWKGLRAGECVGGGIKGWAEHVDARRLLTVALEGTEHYWIESNGKNLGWTEHIPMKRHSDGATYASTEYGSEVFGRKLTVNRGGKSVSVPFAEAWWEAYRKVMPKSWRGITKSDAFNTHNNGVLPNILESLNWRMGTRLGRGLTDFSYQDAELAGAISKHARITDKVRGMLGTAMHFDATVAKAGGLTLVHDFDPHQLEELSYYKETLGRASPDLKIWLLGQWVQLAPDRREIRAFLKREIDGLTKADLKRFDEQVQDDIQKGIFRQSPLLALRYKNDGDLANLFVNNLSTNAQIKAVARSAAEAFAYFRSRKTPLADQVPIFRNIEDAALLTEQIRHVAGLGKLSPGDYIKALDPDESATAGRKTALLKTIGNTAREFFRSRPSDSQIQKVYLAQTTVEALIPLRRARQDLHRDGTLPYRNAAEMLAAMAPERESRSDGYRKQLSALHAEFAEDFVKLRPSDKELRQYLENSDYIHARIALREQRIKAHQSDPRFRFKSAASFLDLMDMDHPNPNEDYVKELRNLRERSLQAFLDLHPSAAEFKRSLKQQTTAEAAIQLRRLRMEMHRNGSWPFRNPSDVIAYMEMEIDNPSDAYKDSLASLHSEYADDFFKLRPKEAEQLKYLRGSKYIQPSIAIRQKRIDLHTSDPSHRLRSAAEYLQLMAMDTPSANEAYINALRDLHVSTADAFIGLRPGPSEWKTFLNGSPDRIADRIELRRRRLKAKGSGKDGALTANDYLEVLVLEGGYNDAYRKALGDFGREIVDGFKAVHPTSNDWKRFASFADSFNDYPLATWARDRAAEAAKTRSFSMGRWKACWFVRMLSDSVRGTDESLAQNPQ